VEIIEADQPHRQGAGGGHRRREDPWG